ncbi:ABC transporter substrate-binding protein [Pararhodobacter oceanensis]|uniref:ABC transporter substrate-binding protein n=1 Tax=Pararhodobacter oceanensis TaxID=2172121 RepID=A0A2T8HY68_9RHOB|nr:ABC transporter substrate-binding protein [Pararhodobacter oceanensis]PVH30339.1 ABC transporter substrate-binding protein [Pararhodobacter oceanensis]
MTSLKAFSLATASMAALMTAAPTMAQARTFTISWWGFNGDKLQEIIVDPFEEMCDCDVIFETGNNSDRLSRLQLRSGAGVDVIYLTDRFSQLGIELGMFQPVDRAQVPNISESYDFAQAPQGEYGPAYSIGRVGIVYDADAVESPITSWDDLWREDLASSVSLPGITTTAGPMVVLRAGQRVGVDAYAETDTAFEQVAELVPNVVTNYNTGSEMINLFSTGEITVSIAQDFALGRIQAAVPSVVWADLEEGSIATLNTINIPVNAAEPELAHMFLDFVLSQEIQQELAEQGVDAPVNTNVVLTEEQAAPWTYGDAMISSLQHVNYEPMNAALDGWIARWNEIFGM